MGTIIDFCNAWGNVASVAGLLIAVIGFGLTIWGVLSAKSSAEQAKIAALQAKEKILRQGTLTDFSSAIGIMEEIIRMHRRKEWEFVLERHTELEKILVELRNGSIGLTEEQQAI